MSAKSLRRRTSSRDDATSTGGDSSSEGRSSSLAGAADGTRLGGSVDAWKPRSIGWSGAVLGARSQNTANAMSNASMSSRRDTSVQRSAW